MTNIGNVFNTVINLLNYKIVFIRLIISLILSSLIGLDRESTKKPAGLRTHVLVCISSTLIMLLSIYIFEIYKGESNIQPDRLGAQVISGIGFLGAGTIIREGNSVKGLTTAASLWAVACIGLAIGAGFYFGGCIATIFVLVTLIAFPKINYKIINKISYLNLIVVSLNKPGQIGKIGKIIGDYGFIIENIDLESNKNGFVSIDIILKVFDSKKSLEIINDIANLEGITEVVYKN